MLSFSVITLLSTLRRYSFSYAILLIQAKFAFSFALFVLNMVVRLLCERRTVRANGSTIVVVFSSLLCILRPMGQVLEIAPLVDSRSKNQLNHSLLPMNKVAIKKQQYREQAY